MRAEVTAGLVETHRGTISSVIDAGRTVANAWQDDSVSSSAAVTGPLGRFLAARDLETQLVAMLEDGAECLDDPIQGTTVPAPPYLVVTSRGPICRATLASGDRLVITVSLFDVDTAPRAYRFLDPTPEESLTVRLR